MGTPSLEKAPFLLTMAAQRYGQRVALQTPEGSISYEDLDAWSWSLEQALLTKGLSSGDVVMVMAHPSTLQVALMAGMWRAGLIFAPVSHRLPASQLATMAKTVDAQLFLHDSEDSPLNDGTIPSLSMDDLQEESLSYTRSKMTLGLVSLSQPATLVWTSGSSSSPKAALHTYGNHFYSALGSNENIRMEGGDQWLLSLPMFHVAGIALVMRAWVAGASVGVPSPTQSLDAAIQTLRPTHLSLVATQLQRLMEMGEPLLSSLQSCKAILLGGSAIPSSLLKQAKEHQLPVHTSYGSTEMASQIATTLPGASMDDCLSAGRVLPYREVRLDDEGGIWVRGQTQFAGYVTEEGLVRPFDPEGWFAMGDLGEFSEKGHLRILGRKDAMFISGGENIQPEEIEGFLEQHQDVVRASVVDIPDQEFGARPVAFVQLQPGTSLEPASLVQYLESHLPRFKTPDHFFTWPDEMITTGIKVSRKQLRALACDILAASEV
ncbi:MAG: o-succinylbenzoate--CoA ligase [Deltaproteobacteria bacterium]|nr:MAG: o-succinylbenzoate--CoA ligase [Deltaproteobacteria bacterium]